MISSTDFAAWVNGNQSEQRERCVQYLADDLRELARRMQALGISELRVDGDRLEFK